MNKAQGSNMVWRLISREKDWWKEVIRKKYIKKPRSKCMDSTWDGKGTSIWSIYKLSIGLIKDNLYWIHGNGRKINI